MRMQAWQDVWFWEIQSRLFALTNLHYIHTASIPFWFGVMVGGLMLR